MHIFYGWLNGKDVEKCMLGIQKIRLIIYDADFEKL